VLAGGFFSFPGKLANVGPFLVRVEELASNGWKVRCMPLQEILLLRGWCDPFWLSALGQFVTWCFWSKCRNRRSSGLSSSFNLVIYSYSKGGLERYCSPCHSQEDEETTLNPQEDKFAGVSKLRCIWPRGWSSVTVGYFATGEDTRNTLCLLLLMRGGIVGATPCMKKKLSQAPI
jgi:hypothetical protein